MKLIIAGSRWIDDPALLDHAFQVSGITALSITEVVSGGAEGVDKMGERWAFKHGKPIKLFAVSPRDYKELGRGAPLRRNRQMAEYADLLLAIWDGVSTGTKHMIGCMEALNKPTFVSKVELIAGKRQ